MAQAGSIYGPVFKACVVSAVPYRVYAVSPEHDEGSNPSDILQRAEVALRKSGQTVFVSLSESRRELWAFRLLFNDRDALSEPGYSSLVAEAVGSSVDTPGKSGVPDFELSLDPAIRTVAQGVFLPPFTASPDTGTYEDHPRSYRPLLRAIETRCLDALLKQGDRGVYEAFGPAAVLNTADSSLTRVLAMLHHDGMLAVSLTSQQCRLRRLSLHSTKLMTPHVWLLPHGVPGRVFPSQKSEDSVERPNKHLARSLYCILSTHFVSNVDLDTLERSTWLRVSSLDTQDLLWPAVLVAEVSPSIGGSTFHGDSEDLHRPLARIEKPDPYTNLAEAMALTRRQNIASQEADPEVGVASLHQTMHPPLPPPPSPRQTQSSSLLPSASSATLSSLLGGNALPMASVTPSAAVTAAPTPTSSGPANHGQLHLASIYPTPMYHTPSLGTPGTAGADGWMDVDDEEDEVGDADFNFFDLPVASRAADVEAAAPEPLQMTMLEPEEAKAAEQDYVVVENIEPQNQATSPWFDRAQFSTLQIDSSALDAKYSSGGQFFVPVPQSEEEQESSSADDKKEPNNNDSEESDDDDDYDDDDDDGDDFDANGDADFKDDFEINSIYSESLDVQGAAASILSQQLLVEDNTELWMKSISTPAQPLNAATPDASRLSSFRQLIPQLVYDGGLLSELLDAPMVTGPVEVICEPALNRIRTVFPGLRRCSMQEMSGNSGPDRLQLLSPPLVAFKRNGVTLKARVSIIKFWRTMGLSPLLDADASDVSVILVTLSSPTVVAGARSLLGCLKTMYEGGQLGQLDLPTFGDVHEGLLTISADLRHISGDAVGDLFETACAQLKHQLQHHFTGKNLVLITACPTSRRGGLLTAGVAFQLALGFETVRTACPDAQWLLCSLDALVSRYNYDIIPMQSDAMRMALLLHSRFPSQSAYQLAGLVPQSVGLQFTPTPPSYLLDDEPVMQIAYLLFDKRWVFVAWSDQWARTTHVDVLRLADHHDKTERALHSVFSEIWARSMAMTKPARPNWRFCIAKCGAMDTSESLIWRRVVAPKPDSDTAHCLMDLPYPRGLTVNDGQAVRHSSQPQSVSSELVDSVVVDSKNETYGVTMSGVKPGVSGWADHITAGYLVQPTPRGHVQLDIRLLLVHRLPGTPQKVMTRVLGQYRRLASLAECRGVSVENTIVPWHVLAVTKLEAASIEIGL